MAYPEIRSIDCSVEELQAQVKEALKHVPGVIGFHAPFITSLAQVHEVAHVVVSCILLSHGYHVGNLSREQLNECQLIQDYVDRPIMEEGL